MSRVPRRPRPSTELDTTDSGARLVHQEGWTEYVPVHELHIDPAYQRDINHAFVGEVADSLDISLLGTIEVARRQGVAAYTCEGCGKRLEHRDYVLDGQHRTLAARHRGWDDVGLSCHVRQSQGSAWEADQYLRMNFKRKNPTSTARYRAAVHAGEGFGWSNDAAVHALLKELGIAVVASTAAGGARVSEVPAVLAGVGTVCRLHERHPDLVRSTLTVLRDAWSDERANAYDSTIFAGVMDLLGAHEAEIGDLSAVTAVLRATTPEELRDAGEQMRGNRKYPVRACIARVLAESYNATRRSHRLREIAPVQYVNALRNRTQAIKGEAMTPEERADLIRRANTLTPEQRSERTRRANAGRTPEQRADIARRAVAARRSA